MEKNKKNVPKIRFKGFTEKWVKESLGDSATIVGGGTPSTNIKEYWNGDIDWYSPAEIGDKIFVGASLRKITELGLKNSSAQILPVGTVLFSSRAGIGNTALLIKDGATNQGFQSIVPDKNKLVTYFIFSRTYELKRYGEINGAGSTFIEISGKQMACMPIFNPKLAEQAQIGNYFQNIDKLIEAKQSRIDKLKNIKKACLEKMFPKKGATTPEIRFKGFSGQWEKKRFGDCVLIQRGGSPRPIEEYITNDENGINWIKIGDVAVGSRYITSTKEKIKPEGEYKSRRDIKGDLILSNSMSFGRPYIVMIDGCIHDGWLLIRDQYDMFDLEFLLQMLSSEYMLLQYKSLASGGVVNNLNSELVQSTIIQIPIKKEQQQIGTFFKNFDNLINQNEQQLTKLKNIKKACLEKMFVNKEDVL